MSKEYFKATNQETGEEKLVYISQATAIRVKRQIGRLLGYDSYDRLCANVFYAVDPEKVIGLNPEQFDEALLAWLEEWSVEVNDLFDADGKKVEDEPETTPAPVVDPRVVQADPDPLP